MAEVRDWAASATGIAPAFVRRILERGWAEKGPNAVEPLPVLAPDALAERIDSEVGDRFIAAPSWQGEVFETGAFARVRQHPLVRDASRLYGNGLMAHSLARLAELSGIPAEVAGLYTTGDHSSTDAGGRHAGLGIGQVEAARGRLVHRVALDGEQVTTYRMLAPTEWNFHPRGVVFQALTSLDPGDDLLRLGSLLVEAVDPCVGYDLEVAGDA
jgi:coenzyme F420-reducing hydrogenase alpha subunit